MTSTDPTQDWIAALSRIGYFYFLTLPAVSAGSLFLSRVRSLKRNKTPHPYGRTAWIYWPSQILIASGILALVVLWYLLWTGPEVPSAKGLRASAISLSGAWTSALLLNHNEHRFNIRSSDFLFVYYIVTLLGCCPSLFLLNEGFPHLTPKDYHSGQGLDQNHQTTGDPSTLLTLEPSPVSEYKEYAVHLLLIFTGCIALAFFFEALPRNNTRVQRESREKEGLTEYDQANLFSRLTFHYVQPLMSLGSRKLLTPADIDKAVQENPSTHHSYDNVSRAWELRLHRYRRSQRKNKTKDTKSSLDGPSLISTVLDAYRLRIARAMTIRLLSFALMYVPIIFFRSLLQFFVEYGEAIKNGTPPPAIANGLLITVGIFVGGVSNALFLSMSSNDCTSVGLEARAALVAMIYRKALRLSPASRGKSTLGEITNHMAVDAESWIPAINLLPLTLTIPFEIIISIVLLYQLLGWSFLAGLAVFAIIMPMQTRMAGFLHSHQRGKLKAADGRLRLMTEILSNIKIIKLSAWEDSFRDKVDRVRKAELGAQKGLSTVRSLLVLVFSSVNLLIILATFTVYSNWGGPDFTPGKMTPDVIFVAITLFQMMGRPLGLISLGMSHVIMLRNSNRRIQKFLMLEEMDISAVQRYDRRESSAGHPPNAAIEIVDGTFAWEKLSDPIVGRSNSVDSTLSPSQAERQPLLPARPAPPTLVRSVLSDISLKILDGNLTAIVGRIGQGKSSLLGAIIGDLYKLHGTVSIYGTVAYVPQQAWIINSTLRDNIVFGKPFDQQKYDDILLAAGLISDIGILPAGDLTEIGERGINLSGGQKQRVSLARAAYQDADIYLMDDPLSAVDAHVDQHLWKHLIGPEGRLRNKTRLIVTHGTHHLNSVDQIVVVKDGTISETGGYQELMDAKDGFYQLITEYTVQERLQSGSKENSSKDSGISSHTTSKGDTGTNVVGDKAKAPVTDKKPPTGGLIAAEKTGVGKVESGVYLEYAKAIKLHNALFCLLLYALSQASQIGSNFWLRHWVKADEQQDERPTYYFLGVYALIVVSFMVTDVTVSYMTNVVCGLQGARTLHDRLLGRVLRMPMSFFDTTPFSADIAAVDSQIPEQLPVLIGLIATAFGIAVVVGYSTPLFLLAVPPLGLVFYRIQGYYVKTSGQLKRLQAVAKSPLYQHFSESLAGVSTIRCTSGLEEQFIQENEKRSDMLVHRTDLFLLTNRWLTVLNVDRLDPSLVGLALTYALNLTNVINFLVRTVSEVQNLFVSVERIQEYSNLPTEAPLDCPRDNQLPQNWPQHGRIVFKDFSARYREGLDLCIRDASFTIESEEKLGVVGRTGAGKSSLTLSLFRIIEAADSYWARESDPSSTDRVRVPTGPNVNGGSIEIDGVDISTLGLRQLRRHLSIIPQEPTLFAGTVRDNLDPFHEHQDSELWEALDRAHLKPHMSSLAEGLSFIVAPNGENFSAGQRSLICLARALLRKSKILVLDEATAAVDVQTDDLIQKTIRKEFKDRTIVTIAHRIKTVMDSDKILVLDHGQVKEFDTPAELLKRTSLFYSLAHQAGEI
ncbi:Multidrug resistance-associated protein 1 [Mortierella sp. GBA43]|nr:Multidrug resistance-associated protein 1 [Mortierella sp. GBA43]